MDKAHYAVLIPAEGAARPQAIDLTGDVLAELQDLVGGYIETYRTRSSG